MAKILIVDDDLEAVSAIAAVLASVGHRARTACNGVEGLRQISEDLPDLIVLDVEMPVLDGPGMIETLAVQRAGQAVIPIVLISSAVKIEKIARWAGTPHYLKKLFTAARLLVILNDALRR